MATEETMTQPTCKSCRHNRASWIARHFVNSVWWNCDIDYTPPKYNPVDGTTKEGYYTSCGVARGIESICGKDAQRWEPREKKDFFVFLKRV
jgi:hypothetical protein